MKLILAANDEAALDFYTREIRKFPVELETVTKLADMHDRMIRDAYQGVFIDVPTKILSTKDEKINIYEVWQGFPVCLLKHFPETHRLEISIRRYRGPEQTLDFFLNRLCHGFTAHSIKKVTRIPLVFNVLLSLERHYFPDRTERTCTLNVSRKGCFIPTGHDFKVGDEVWFTIRELEDGLPVSGIVKWHVPWGTRSKVPGIGVRLKEIIPEQSEKLKDLILAQIPDIMF